MNDKFIHNQLKKFLPRDALDEVRHHLAENRAEIKSLIWDREKNWPILIVSNLAEEPCVLQSETTGQIIIELRTDKVYPRVDTLEDE